jgi:hypothetical protein
VSKKGEKGDGGGGKGDRADAKSKPPPLIDLKPITKSKKSNYTDWAAHLVPSLIAQTIVDDTVYYLLLLVFVVVLFFFLQFFVCFSDFVH